MLLAMIVSTVLVLTTVLIHYEILRFASLALPHIHLPPRQRILVVIVAAFLAHTIEVWMFALAYFLLANHFGLGSFQGDFDGSLHDHLYFSSVTYTSLGFGDVSPIGGLRLVSGVEALTGLMMIGWSASFTYLAMEKFWSMHGPRRR
jgi:hypothetical protein